MYEKFFEFRKIKKQFNFLTTYRFEVLNKPLNHSFVIFWRKKKATSADISIWDLKNKKCRKTFFEFRKFKKTQFNLLNTYSFAEWVECREPRSVAACPDYQKLSPEDQLKTIQKNCYCTNCLSNQYRWDNCPSSKRCQVCNGYHHTTLHKPAKQFSRTPYALSNSNVQQQNNSSSEPSLLYKKQITILKLKKGAKLLRIKNHNSKPKTISRTANNLVQNHNQRFSKRANLIGLSASQIVNINQLSSTRKPLVWTVTIVTSFCYHLSKKSKFSTLMLSLTLAVNLRFCMDAISSYLDLPLQHQSSTTVQ